jgi:hypothetical protein
MFLEARLVIGGDPVEPGRRETVDGAGLVWPEAVATRLALRLGCPKVEASRRV